ncbi:DsbA family protein [Litorimonas sp.]|uniref:DsbA family protein n=1 Tax=Litorimonas sp. TaxID=1892381 RepID=UPI003A89F7A1
MKRFLIAVSATAMAISFNACAEARQGPDVKEADVERIIKDYLMENPEIIRDALIELELRQDREAIEAVSSQIFNDPRDVSIGPKDAKVTVVEFFDYNCGFCKSSTQWVEDLMEDYPDEVRIVFKELPILDSRSNTSRYAAKAALAAARQGKYTEVHFDLMNERSLTKERIRQIIEDTGADMDTFDADMKDVALDRHIEDTLLLSNRIPSLTGTPFFLVNKDFVSGANTQRLDELLANALES